VQILFGEFIDGRAQHHKIGFVLLRIFCDSFASVPGDNDVFYGN